MSIAFGIGGAGLLAVAVIAWLGGEFNQKLAVRRMLGGHRRGRRIGN
jgi:hypothetical protein